VKMIKLSFVTILSLVCSGGLASQSAADSLFSAKAKEEGRVLLYTSLAAEDNKAFRSAFENANPGVKLEIYRASGTTVLQKILTETRAGSNLVDVVLTEGTVLHALKDKTLLVKFDSPERNAFDARFKDKEGYWTDIYPQCTRSPITQSWWRSRICQSTTPIYWIRNGRVNSEPIETHLCFKPQC
jgi:ABC-type glycerol-3-phosphate transport system substrate-binding protein